MTQLSDRTTRIVKVVVAVSLLWLNAPPAFAQEMGVVDDLYVGRHTITPMGGLGRYQNLLLRSEEFNHAGWVKSASVTSTTDTIVAPDGQTTADAVTFGTTGLDSIKQASATAAGSVQFTGSIWLKAASGTPTIRLALQDEAGTPAVTYANALLDTTWQRFQVTKTFSSGTGNAVFLIDDNTNTSTTFEVHLWGAQLESGVGTANVYVKTSAGTVTTSRGLVSNADLLVAGSQTITGGQTISGTQTITGTLAVNDTTAGALDVAGGAQFGSGNVSLITTAGKLAGLSGTYLANLDGSALTGLTAANVTGTLTDAQVADTLTASALTVTNGGTVGQAAGPLLTFDDTANELEISGGNVGIGTTSPAAKLQVLLNGGNGSIGLGDYGIAATATSGQATLAAESIGDNYANLNLGSDMSGTRRFWHISKRTSGTTGHPHGLTFWYYDGAAFQGPHLVMTTGGAIGIGTTSPQNKLDVEGAAVIGAAYSGTNTGPANGLLVEGSVGIGTTSPAGKLEVVGDVYFGGADRNIVTNGNYSLTIQPAANLNLGTANSDAINIGRTDSNILTTLTGLLVAKPFANTTTSFNFQNAAGTSILDVDTTNGRIGIGTTSPRGLLHAASSASIDDLVVNAEATTNRITNPSFETGLTSWNFQGLGISHAQSAEQAVFGRYSDKVTWSSSEAHYVEYGAGVSASTAYAASMYVYSSSTAACFNIWEWDGAAGTVQYTACPTQTNTWQRLTLTLTTRSDTTALLIRLFPITGSTSSGTAYVDGVQLEQKGYVTPYADGSFGPGHAWTGTAHGSTTTRTAGAVVAYQTINSAGGLGAVGRGTAPALRIEQDGTGPIFSAFDVATEVFRIADGGSVGIGTATPAALLDVQGAAQFGSGNVNLIDATGKIAGISGTYFASLDGSALTGLTAANVTGSLTDAQVSDTLTASLFVGSGSTTTAVDLATAEVAGVLPDANVANTLTASALTVTDGGTVGQAAGPLLTFDDTANELEISGGNVGIGTTSPGAALQVNAATATTPGLIVKTTDDNAAQKLFVAQNSAGAALFSIDKDGGMIFGGTGSSSGFASAARTFTNAASSLALLYQQPTFNYSADSGNLSYGDRAYSILNSAQNTVLSGSHHGTYGTAEYRGLSPGSVTSVIGVGGTGASGTTATGAITNAYGGNFAGVHQGTGTMTNAYGMWATAERRANAGTITTGTGVFGRVQNNDDTGSMGIGKALWAGAPGGTGTITTAHGLYVTNQGRTNIANAYGLYVESQTGASSANYAAVFAGGNVGIGTTAPASTLHVVGNTQLNNSKRYSNYFAFADVDTTNGSWYKIGTVDVSPDGAFKYLSLTGTIAITNDNATPQKVYKSTVTFQAKENSTSHWQDFYYTNEHSYSELRVYQQGTGSTAGNKYDLYKFCPGGGTIYGGVYWDLVVNGNGTFTPVTSAAATALPGAPAVQITPNTNNAFIIPSGNVSIGTTAPGALLDVQGAAQFGTGDVNLITAAGKITAINSTYFASLDGSALTNINATGITDGTIVDADVAAGAAIAKSKISTTGTWPDADLAAAITRDAEWDSVAEINAATTDLDVATLTGTETLTNKTLGSTVMQNGATLGQAAGPLLTFDDTANELDVSGGNVGIGDASPAALLTVGNGDLFQVNTAGHVGVMAGAPGDGIAIRTGGTYSFAGGAFGIYTEPTGDAGATTNLAAYYGRALGGSGTFTTTTLAGMYLDSNSKGAAQTVTSNYGVLVASEAVTSTNNYGAYIGTISGGSTFNTGLRITGTAAAATNYAIYADAAAQNYFAGNVGIGTTSPNYLLTAAGAARLTGITFPATASYVVSTGDTATASYSPGFGSASLITDGTFPAEGTTWNAGTVAVQLNAVGNTNALTVDLGLLYQVGRVRVQGDNNDTYAVEYSTDNSAWTVFYTAPTDPSAGLRTRDSGWLTPVTARYLRVYATAGDGSYSIGELEVSGYAGVYTTTGNVGIGTSAPAGLLDVNGLLTVKYGGNVGIGTTSPGALLDVRGSAIFNEAGADADFRIEGDTQANLFVVDASQDNVGIGSAPGTGTRLYVNLTSSADQASGVQIETTHDTATGGTVYGERVNTYASHAAGTMNSVQGVTSQAVYKGTSAASPAVTNLMAGFYRNTIAGVSPSGTISNSYTLYASPTSNQATGTPAVTLSNQYGVYVNNQGLGSGTNGLTITNAYGLYIANQTTAATSNYALVTNTGNVVFNEGGDATTDVRIEGDTDANLFFADASADRVGIGTAAPAALLDVQGAAQFGSDNVNLIDATGKIAGISSTTFASLDGSALTGLTAANITNGTFTDAQVSDTLTASLVVGSGSTTTAVDLATAEVAGILPDANVANTLTASALTVTDGGTVGQAAGPVLTFDDTANELEISGGNVGIGTTAPSGLLNLYTTDAAATTLNITGVVGGWSDLSISHNTLSTNIGTQLFNTLQTEVFRISPYQAYFSGTANQVAGQSAMVGIGYQGGGGFGGAAGNFVGNANGTYLAVNASSGFTGSLLDAQTYGVSRLVVQGGGNVGLGTKTPQTQLELTGTLASPYGGLGRYENRLLQSEAFSTSWTATNLTLTDGKTAPDGGTAADELKITAGGSTGNVAQTVTISAAAAADYVFSVWLKASSVTGAQLDLDLNGTSAVDTTSGALTLTTAWQRYSLKATTVADTTSLIAKLTNTSTTLNATIEAWGAQLEQASTPGAYAKTTTTAVAAARGLVVSGKAALLGDVDLGDIAAHTIKIKGTVKGNSPTLVVDQDTAADIVDLRDTGVSVFKIADGGAITATGPFTVDSPTFHVNSTTHRVGIGTTSPTQTLEVSGNVLLTDQPTGSAERRVSIGGAASGGEGGELQLMGAGAYADWQFDNLGGNLRWHSAGTVWMNLDTAGNLNIEGALADLTQSALVINDDLQINGTNTLTFGAAANPLITTTGAPITLRADSDNNDAGRLLDVGGNGTNVYLTVNNTGLVGIGTTSPGTDLEVAPTAHRAQIFLNSRGTGDALNTDLYFGDTGAQKWALTHRPSDQNSDFVIWRNNGGWAKVMTAQYSDGFIGIGTTSPGAALEVSGNLLLTKEAARTISVANSTTSDTAGGALSVTAGAGVGAGVGGAMTLAAGAGSGTSAGGTAVIKGGAGGAGGTLGASLTLNGGFGGTGGHFALVGSNLGSTGSQPASTISTGNAGTNGNGGNLTVTLGAGNSPGTGGVFSLTAGQGGATGAGGTISLVTGAGGVTSGSSGALTIGTGAFTSGAFGTISVKQGANTRMFVDATGSVGIGTTAPATKLEVAGSLLYTPGQGVSTKGLVGLWHVNAETKDWSGYGYEATNSGATCTAATAGKFGSGCLFDADTDRITVGEQVAHRVTDFAVEAWVKYTTCPNAGSHIFSKYSPGAIEVDAQTTTCKLTGFLWSTDQATNAGLTTDEAYNDNQWHHVVFTRDSAATQIYLYVDGKLKKNGADVAYNNSQNQLQIGNRTGYNQAFAGTIDEVAFWNRPLSAEEVRSRYLAGAALHPVETGSRVGGTLLVDGNVGVGTTAPTALVHLKAGTATANTAPLKFTAGTNLTAPEAGAVEWDGTNLFVTQTTGPTRKTVAFTDSAMTGNATTATTATHLAGGGAGTLPYQSGAGATAMLATGVSGDVLQSGGAGAPSWSTPASANTVSTLVKRDGSGNFSAGTITAALTGAASLNVLKAGDTMSGNLTFSDAQKVIGGTATTADLTLQTTTGVGAAGADMHFLVGNNGATEALTILNSGNVGIGTTSPSVKLHVNGGSDAVLATASSGYLIVGDSAGSNLVLDDNEFMARNNGIESTLFLQAEGGDVFIHNNQGAGTEFIVKDNGYVGIGTTNPAEKFDVVGNIRLSTGGVTKFYRPDNTTLGLSINAGTGNNFITGSAGSIIIAPGASGDLTVDLSSSRAFGVRNSDGTQTFFRVRADGNVGIGTTAPAAKLDVQGDVWTSGIVSSPYGGLGTYENALLQSEAFGTTWTNSGLTITDGQTGPDSGITADKLANSGAAAGYVEQVVTPSGNSTDYIFSVWLKAGDATGAELKLTPNGTSPVVGTSTLTLTTAWQRYSIKATTGSSGTTTLAARLTNTSTTSAQYIYAWGAQVEKAATPGVYVETTTTAVAVGKGLVTNADLRLVNLSLSEAGTLTLGDANLYRDSANVLKTDDALVVNSTLLVNGAAANAGSAAIPNAAVAVKPLNNLALRLERTDSTTYASSLGVRDAANNTYFDMNNADLIFRRDFGGAFTPLMTLKGDGTGSVGIGTAAPGYRLDVINPNSQIHFGAAADQGGWLNSINSIDAVLSAGSMYNGSAWIAKATSAGALVINSNGIYLMHNTGLTSGNSFTQTSRLRIETDGDVGIGTDSPAMRLDVVGDVVRRGAAGSNDRIELVNSAGNQGIELRSGTTLGTPFIDLTNDNATDYDARIRLAGDDTLSLEGASLSIPDGNFSVNGTTTLGDAAADTITLTGSLNSNVNFLDAATGVAYTVAGSDATGTNTAGGDLTIRSGAGIGAGAGGALNLTGGAGGSSGLGGNITITAGSSTGVTPAGSVTIAGGAESSNGSGSVTVRGGEGVATNGGGLTLRGGNGGNTNTSGGTVTITGGSAQGSVGGNPGNVTITGGASINSGTKTGGSISLTSGAGGTTSGNSGAVTLNTGTVTSGTVGSVVIQTGGTERAMFSPTAILLNDAGNDLDFRVEGDNNANMLVIDAGTDTAAIGAAVTASTLLTVGSAATSISGAGATNLRLGQEVRGNNGSYAAGLNVVPSLRDSSDGITYDAYGIRVLPAVYAAGATSTVNYSGLRILNGSPGCTGTCANQYGIYIENQTFANNDYGVYIAGADTYAIYSATGNNYFGGNIASPYGGLGTYENLLTYSEQMDQAAWGKADATVSADAAVGPDGASTADQINEAATGNPHLYRSFTATAGQAYTFSVWMKAGTETSVRLAIGEAGGTFTEWGSQSVTLTTTWQRFALNNVTVTSIANGTRVVIDPPNTSLNFLVWGAQVEKASAPGVYVETTTTAVAASRGLVTNSDLRMLNLSLAEGGTVTLGDANLYNSAANVLKTDDTLNIAGNLQVTGAGPHYISAGDVGIGTTNPGATGETYNRVLELSHATDAAVMFAAGGTAQRPTIGSNGAGFFMSSSGHATASNNVLSFRTEETNSQFTPTERMRIDSAGFVGIGTASPSTLLHLYSAADTNFSMDSSINAPIVSFKKAGAAKWALLMERDTPAYGLAANDLGFYNYATTSNSLVLKSATGNVGIGTTGPGNLLAISGTSTGSRGIFVDNTNTAGYAVVRLNSANADAGVGTALHQFGSTWTDAGGARRPSQFDIASWGANGIAISAEHAAGIINFFTAGSVAANERMRIDAAGKVGIGTTAPVNQLTVWSASNALRLGNDASADTTAADLHIINQTNVPKIKLTDSNVASGYISVSSNGLVFNTDTVNNMDFRTGASSGTTTPESGGTSRLYIKSDGYVGVGTTNPASMLEVASGQITAPVGSAGAPSYTFSGDANSGIYSVANDKIGFATNSGLKAVIDTLGYLGLNVQSPTARLDVLSAGTGTVDIAHFRNDAAAANNNAARMSFIVKDAVGNRDVGGVVGMMTDITSGAYKGALVFDTANNAAPVERMRLDNAGRLGLGTPTPQTQLELTGTLSSPYGGLGTYENLLVRSEQFENGSWVKSANVSVTANSVAGPDGSTATADKADFTATSDENALAQDSIAAGSNPFTFSVWIRAVSGTASVRLFVRETASGSPGGQFRSDIAPTTTWQRYAISGTFSSAAGNVSARIGNASGSTQSIYVWGAQLEQNSNAGVYVETTTAAVAASRGLVTNADLRLVNLTLGEAGAVTFGGDAALERSSANTLATASGDSLTVSTNLTVNGNTTLGDAAADTITLTGSLNSNVNFLDAATGVAYTVAGSDATGTNTAGGALTIVAGAGIGTGIGGDLNLRGGAAGTGNSNRSGNVVIGGVTRGGGQEAGNVTIAGDNAGVNASGWGGSVTLTGGTPGPQAAPGEKGGAITITAGAGAGDTTNAGGTITLTGGAGNTTGAGGAVSIITGAGGGTSGNSGALTLGTGTFNGGSAFGTISLKQGANTRLFIDAAGSIGIGTTNPGATLDVAGVAQVLTESSSGVLRLLSSSTQGGRLRVQQTLSGTTAGDWAMHFDPNYVRVTGLDAAQASWWIYNGAWTNVFAIDDDQAYFSGNVGIGTTVPGEKLDVAGTGVAGRVRVTGTSSAGTEIPGVSLYQDATFKGGMYFDESHAGVDIYSSNNGTGTTPTISILGGANGLGSVGIGTTSPGAKLEISGTEATEFVYLSAAGAAAAARAVLKFNRARGTISSPTVVASGDILGTIFGIGYDGAANQIGGAMSFEVDGTPGASDMPGRIVFETTPDGSATRVERLRITSTGSVGIGTTSPASRLDVAGPSGGSMMLQLTSGSSDAAARNWGIGLDNNAFGNLEFMVSATQGGAVSQTPKVVINSNGNVGIGDTTPAEAKLVVAGDAAVRRGDKILLDSDDGTADTYVIRNAGATTMSWFVDGIEIATVKKQVETR